MQKAVGKVQEKSGRMTSKTEIAATLVLHFGPSDSLVSIGRLHGGWVSP